MQRCRTVGQSRWTQTSVGTLQPHVHYVRHVRLLERILWRCNCFVGGVRNSPFHTPLNERVTRLTDDAPLHLASRCLGYGPEHQRVPELPNQAHRDVQRWCQVEKQEKTQISDLDRIPSERSQEETFELWTLHLLLLHQSPHPRASDEVRRSTFTQYLHQNSN